MVYGDRVRLEQVVNNLVTNAVKYSPEADKVLLNITTDGQTLQVAVQDFGIGIPKDKISRVFDRFFRVEKTSYQFQGLGLGLYICAEIIARHGGIYTWKAKKTRGMCSTFQFL